MTLVRLTLRFLLARLFAGRSWLKACTQEEVAGNGEEKGTVTKPYPRHGDNRAARPRNRLVDTVIRTTRSR